MRLLYFILLLYFIICQCWCYLFRILHAVLYVMTATILGKLVSCVKHILCQCWCCLFRIFHAMLYVMTATILGKLISSMFHVFVNNTICWVFWKMLCSWYCVCVWYIFYQCWCYLFRILDGVLYDMIVAILGKLVSCVEHIFYQ